MSQVSFPANGRGVTAVLGPTNTGKTHLAIERMVSHKSGVIGLPLRLLAREVYNRIEVKVGSSHVSLVTGEERIEPATARFQVCTVEAMPEETDAEFVAIDEVQIATDLERGHIFTDRILNLRGRSETMLLGAETMHGALRDLLPGVNVVTRPRMSVLQHTGSRKITRMPARTAIVAFSVDEVYAIAELVRRERGGAAVVMGSLSPRTRNAQVELFQSGDVDFLIATDAIGMGLNLDVNHVAFAGDSKFDGFQFRKLTAAELAQIAGRAGRHTRDGTFGVTSKVTPFSDELVEALETHVFEPDKVLTWRNRKLDFSSLSALRDSLDKAPDHIRLMKAPRTTDVQALDLLSREPEVEALAIDAERVRLLWEVARTPDYRKISPAAHAEILQQVYLDICRSGKMNTGWVEAQLEQCDRPSGEIDALSQRIANVRTWTYLTNRKEWLDNAEHWQEKARNIEDRLSDALHEALTRRFVDRRTSVLMKRLKENKMLEAEIAEDGAVQVEGHHVGHLRGFRFVSDKDSSGNDAKAINNAASKALAAEIERRAERLSAAPNSDIVIDDKGYLRWIGEPVARLGAGDGPLRPQIIMLADEHLTGPAQEKAAGRLSRWIANHVNTLLKPLADLAADTELPAQARGIAFRLIERFGVLPRREAAAEVRQIDQDMRAKLRRHGVKFGAYSIFVPALLKPAPTELICLLWAVFNDKLDAKGRLEVPALSASGRTSVAVDPELDPIFYSLAGFRVLGSKAVRVDILERLADLIRPATNWKPGNEGEKPEGAYDGRAFYVTPAMMSILGATHEDMEKVLKGLGYRQDKRLESEVKPSDDTEEAKPAGENSEPSKSEQASAPGEEPAVAGEKAQTRSPETLAADPEPADTEEPEPPKMISIWRYGREERPQRSSRSADGKRGSKPGAAKSARGKNAKGRKGPAKHQNKTKPARSTPIDPDSPFAKLAKLKEELNQRK